MILLVTTNLISTVLSRQPLSIAPSDLGDADLFPAASPTENPFMLPHISGNPTRDQRPVDMPKLGQTDMLTNEIDPETMIASIEADPVA